MRLILLSILFFLAHESFSQDLKGSLKVLTYIKGCHGSCKYSYANDSNNVNCGLPIDSILDIVNIFQVNGDYFINGKLLSKQDKDSLNQLMETLKIKISGLIKELVDERNAKFTPPRANCFEFEEYQIYMETKVLSFIVLNGELNENGSLLQQKDIDTFERLKEKIK